MSIMPFALVRRIFDRTLFGRRFISPNCIWPKIRFAEFYLPEIFFLFIIYARKYKINVKNLLKKNE